MGKADHFELGTWNATCDVCGFKFKANQLRDRWDGLKVCSKDYEPRHPLDRVRGVHDDQSVPWTRSEKTNEISPGDVTKDDF